MMFCWLLGSLLVLSSCNIVSWSSVWTFLLIVLSFPEDYVLPRLISSPSSTKCAHPLHLICYDTAVRYCRSLLEQKYLRDALQDIARMHTSGQHRNCWELKPEFKTAAEAGAGAGAEADNEA